MELTKKQQSEAVRLLKTLKKDAELALSGHWNRSDYGFECQIEIIDNFLHGLKPKVDSKKFKQKKLFE